jgi:primosomal protein N' (replication factor Y)
MVGIINADTALHFPDYRSGEVTFSLLTQVAGRAGRGDEPASVVLQTYSPDHYAVRHALGHDYLSFAREEIRYRKLLKFPPYSRLVTCTFSGKEDDAVRTEAERVAREMAERFAVIDAEERPEVMGPSTAYIHRLRGVYRWQVTVRGLNLERFSDLWPRGRGWSIDVDPGL